MRRPKAADHVFCAGALVLTFAMALIAQNIDQPAFEVASIQRSGSNSPPMGIRRTSTQFMTTNTPLSFLIRWAYDVDEDRVIGAPKGLDAATYDILAKIPDGPSAPGRLQMMMQSLLADRFKLRVHHETRELPSYSLVTDKGGPKVRFVPIGEGISQNPFTMTARGRLSGTKVLAAMLAQALSEQLRRPVEDQTGIREPFDFTLEWQPESDTAPPLDDRASIFTAIREQLGFRLVARKSPVDVIVIDSVERNPTEN